jgi:acetoin utilization protein AcuC
VLNRPLFIGSEIYRHSPFARQHPLAIDRVSTVMDLARALGWLDDEAYLEAAPAPPEALARFHDPLYIAALQRAEREGWVDAETQRRHGLGCNGNPVHALVFTRPATACGATLLAVEHLLERGGIVHSPAGGTHHGRRDRAAGFCYLNDPVLGILRLLDRGLARVAYVDLDAHHADGVQDALGGDPSVLIVSVHEQGRWPYTGAAGEPGAVNLPVPPGFNDSELDLLVETAIVPLVRGFAPEALVLQCGADGLADDPLSRLALSNGALWRAVAALKGLAPRLLVLGGGGYNPWSVARCWTGIWAILNGIAIPAALPAAGEAVLRRLAWARSQGRDPPAHWFTTLADPPRAGPVRPELRALVGPALARAA